MGCIYSTWNRIEVAHQFTPTERTHLTQSWSIVKTYKLRKFADDILAISLNRSPSLRRYWMSKIVVDGNNFDYSQSESCLRTDLSWHIELREYNMRFVMVFDRLLSSINDESNLNAQLRMSALTDDVPLVDYEALLVLKNSFMDILRERFQKSNHEFTIEHEKAWEKFLSLILRSLTNDKQSIREPTQVIISTNNTPNSSVGEKVN